MAIPVEGNTAIEALSASERDALASAATWYFKYHGPIIAKLADDPSATAMARREDFHDLHAALWKLGIRLALPDRLTPRG